MSGAVGLNGKRWYGKKLKVTMIFVYFAIDLKKFQIRLTMIFMVDSKWNELSSRAKLKATKQEEGRQKRKEYLKNLLGNSFENTDKPIE